MKTDATLIVAEEPLMRLGLRQFLHQEMGIKLGVEAGSTTQALKQQAEHAPALVIIFLCDKAQSETLRLVRELRRRRRQQAVLVRSRAQAKWDRSGRGAACVPIMGLLPRGQADSRWAIRPVVGADGRPAVLE